jgi:hypothetical protein
MYQSDNLEEDIFILHGETNINMSRIWKEAVMAYFKFLSWRTPTVTEASSVRIVNNPAENKPVISKI